MPKLHLGLGLLAGCLLACACSSGGDGGLPTKTNMGVNQGTSTSPSTSPATGGGTTPANPGPSNNGVDIPIATPVPTTVDPTTYRRAPVCDANGQNCKCITLASFGASASKSYGGGNGSTTAFEEWLTTKSNAQVTFVPNKPAITAEYLAGFDVIILQDLRKWNLSTAEIQAFQDWIAGGGGVIALSGYFSDDAAEIEPTNKLLQTSGMSLLATEAPGADCPDSAASMCVTQNPPPYQKCCYCWENTVPLTELNTASPFNANITAIGGYRGRAVNPGTGTTVVSFGKTPVAATNQVGLGKVYIFGDEWVTYTSQWGDGSKPVPADPYNPCWDSVAQKPRYAGHVFQTMQFWYNAILNVSPPTPCDFKIEEPAIIPAML